MKTLIIAEQGKIASIYDSNSVITDLVIERGAYQVGDIYIGKVETILPGINAAFIVLNNFDINGFIHFNELGHLKRNKDEKNISKNLDSQATIMVQILKEPSGKKGPTLTGYISLKGYYLSLLPFNNVFSYATKTFGKNEKLYLRAVFILLKPKNFGIQVKKNTSHATLRHILQDFYVLVYEWNLIFKSKCFYKGPLLVSRKKNFISKIIKKFYGDKINNILIDSYNGAKRAGFILNQFSEEKKFTFYIKFFSNCNFFIYDYNLDLIVYDLLQPRVNLLGGGYIFIEKSEALTTIDVNSGSFNYLNSPRETILLVNRRAAKQISKHLKLRNISGLIVIDFIDMKYQEDQLELLVYFDSLLKQENEKVNIIQLSKLGLVELTKKRRGKKLLDMFPYNLLSPSYLFYDNDNLKSLDFVSQNLYSETFPLYSF